MQEPSKLVAAGYRWLILTALVFITRRHRQRAVQAF